MIADIILILHFFIVVFVTSGFFIIPFDYIFKWCWIGIKIRLAHTLVMLVIITETILGFTCPLTIIENQFRGNYQSSTFVGYWLQKIIYWELPESFFILLYSGCFAWTIVMWFVFPIRKKQLQS